MTLAVSIFFCLVFLAWKLPCDAFDLQAAQNQELQVGVERQESMVGNPAAQDL